jgi:dethiobiotin synthetase
MQGLVTIGTSAGEAELAVADALCATRPGARRFDAAAAGPAAPLIAARLAGSRLEPEGLLEGARRAGEGAELLVVATSGGLMAPITERYLNRDLARELALPVVLAAPAAPGLTAGALLALDSARGNGLAVAAVVIAGWPDPPSRVLLEERALLEQMAGVPVLADASAAPVDDWAAATDRTAQVRLESYTAWEARPVGDPRATPRASIMEAMLEIVGAEGPMTASRAYALYNRASGGRKLTSVARAPLSSSIYWLAQERKVVLVRKDEIPWQDDDVVRMPDSPAVRVRELGPRTLEEVPLDEIAELVRRLRAAGAANDGAEAKRAVLNAYGLVRLTSRADEYLGLALGLADGTGGEE